METACGSIRLMWYVISQSSITDISTTTEANDTFTSRFPISELGQNMELPSGSMERIGCRFSEVEDEYSYIYERTRSDRRFAGLFLSFLSFYSL